MGSKYVFFDIYPMPFHSNVLSEIYFRKLLGRIDIEEALKVLDSLIQCHDDDSSGFQGNYSPQRQCASFIEPYPRYAESCPFRCEDSSRGSHSVRMECSSPLPLLH